MNPFDVYAVRRPVKRSWSFERTTVLDDGTPFCETIEMDKKTRKEAEDYRATFQGIGVDLGPLYSTE